MGREWKPGDVVGQWTVVGEPARDDRRRLLVPVRCACGVTRAVRAEKLAAGKSLSCGCLARQALAEKMTLHGWSRTVEYHTWRDMIQRCTNPKSPNYPNYGGRGIKVCTRWRDAEVADLHECVGPDEIRWTR